MQFYAVLLPVATLLAATANAAECVSQHGSQRCVDSTDLLTNREVFCNSPNNYLAENQVYEFYGANDYMGIFSPHNIPNQQACWDSTLDIIDQCLGHRNGGSYSVDGWEMEINFCAFE
ncbi:uncharacterized protein N7458_000587 [Penicillium daleae]|uniref:Uncharacterized protein n=1 Tax=Penicillium daleae TaxID=63821 RepID=A0AAD6CIP2_9EURO|nr:uncharacterized protein N7458_000587 [Penicillium daleae]KAJ5464901.1 hypothetical protein N7458_000587 [Penicillium daleae]